MNMDPPQHARDSDQRAGDGLLFVAELTLELEDQPAVYNEFLAVMKDLKDHAIDTLIATLRVSTLFHEHPRLIVGFQTLLRPGANGDGVTAELDHTMVYINAVKQRCSTQPEIYTEFLRMLYACRQQQRPIRELLDQVAYLFSEYPDLHREFNFYVPGAIQYPVPGALRAAAEKAQRPRETQTNQSQ